MNGVATSSKIGSSPRTGADEDYAEDRRDEQAMVGGFAIFLLMTKVPGECIEYNMFWSKTEEQREEIRHAFKKAVM